MLFQKLHVDSLDFSLVGLQQLNLERHTCRLAIREDPNPSQLSDTHPLKRSQRELHQPTMGLNLTQNQLNPQLIDSADGTARLVEMLRATNMLDELLNHS